MVKFASQWGLSGVISTAALEAKESCFFPIMNVRTIKCWCGFWVQEIERPWKMLRAERALRDHLIGFLLLWPKVTYHFVVRKGGGGFGQASGWMDG